jgi:hypothetical protein
MAPKGRQSADPVTVDLRSAAAGFGKLIFAIF